MNMICFYYLSFSLLSAVLVNSALIPNNRVIVNNDSDDYTLVEGVGVTYNIVHLKSHMNLNDDGNYDVYAKKSPSYWSLRKIYGSVYSIESAVANIVGQLDRWNIQTGQNGNVTSSQGGFRLETGEIRAPDVAFTPEEIYRSLTEVQGTSFRGPAFSPTFVVEVADVKYGDSPKFKELDSKFKDTYFDARTSVELGWLIDPINDEIWVYKRNSKREVFRHHRKWGDLDGGDILPEFTLEVWSIKDAMSKEPPRPPILGVENLNHTCPYCSQNFNSGYLLMKHMENIHLRKNRIIRDGN
ncbi:20564_t:CDS:2 [Funneliformis geosporum]|nr:20564_t:CDS:2 [Funneliformis geosporum]